MAKKQEFLHSYSSVMKRNQENLESCKQYSLGGKAVLNMRRGFFPREMRVLSVCSPSMTEMNGYQCILVAQTLQFKAP